VLLSGSITTRDMVTATSGRGIGLSSVQQRVQALGGERRWSRRQARGRRFGSASRWRRTRHRTIGWSRTSPRARRHGRRLA
jgi:hypothetical protein